jgi:hypothetical protein
VVRTIFCPKRDEKKGGWKNEIKKNCVIYTFIKHKYIGRTKYISLGLQRFVVLVGGNRSAYRILVETPERKRLIERPRL